MEMIWMILPAAYFMGLIALVVFFGGGGESSRTIVNGRRDDDDVVGVFDDITDPAKSYLICNIHHDDSIGDDSSFDWDDSSTMDDMSSSSWDS